MKDFFGEQTLESMNQAVWYNQWTLNGFKKYLKGRILEIGCGIGNFTKSLQDFGEVYTIDIREDYVEKTREFLSKKVHVGLGDIEKGKYFFDHTKFNTEVCINVLEHIKDDKKALKNLYNLLESDGYLILIVPCHPTLYGEIDRSIGHFRRYTKKNLEIMLEEAGFKIIKCRRLNFLGGIGWFFSGKIFSDSKVSDTKIRIFNFFAPLFLPLEKLIEPPIATSVLAICKKEGI